MNYCPNCGTKLNKSAIYCHKCGKECIIDNNPARKTKKDKSKTENVPIFEKLVGKIYSTDTFDIIIRIIQFEVGEFLVDIRKWTHSGKKADGLAVHLKTFDEFKDIMSGINYDNNTKNIILPPEIDETDCYEFLTEEKTKCKSLNIDSMFWDENNAILFNLLKFDNNIDYLDIRKTNVQKNKRKMGISIRIDLIPQFKEIINKIDINNR